MGDEARERVQRLGEEVRALKAELKAQGLTAAGVNGSKAVQALVAELREAKAQLDAGDELTDKAFADRQRKEQEERKQERRVRVDQERRALQSMEAQVDFPLCQRKIFHLFRFAGSGPTFHYEPPARLNVDQTGFGAGPEPEPAVYVTEKWDGTTMQATNQAIFRRQEVVGKHKSKDPSDRYELKLVAWREAERGWRGFDFLEADARVVEALSPHLSSIEALDNDLCVYFECLHSRINATYQHLEGFADIRVFDFARAASSGWKGGAFLNFGDTVALASRFSLPLVGWQRRERLYAAEIWDELEAAKSRQYATAAAPLEGFVVREAQAGRIAKARVENLVGTLAGTAAAVPVAALAAVPAVGPVAVLPRGISPAAPAAAPVVAAGSGGTRGALRDVAGHGCMPDAKYLEKIGIVTSGSVHMLSRPRRAA